MTYKDSMTPLDYFLFESKRGHCEYFATAMALILRANGIPSKITNGFAGGERKGFQKPENETAWEFARRMAEQHVEGHENL